MGFDGSLEEEVEEAAAAASFPALV